jgi:hypothetical protein
MRKLITLVLLLTSMSVFADISSTAITDAGFNKLSESQKAELIKSIAEKANAPVSSPDDVEKWTRIGTQIAQGLGAAAKELNVSVNEFAKTPVGQLTTVLIVWHIFGNQLMHIFGGILFWVIGLSIVRFFAKKGSPDTIEYSDTDKNIFGNYVITNITKNSLSEELMIGSYIMSGVVLIVGTIIFFS